MDHSGLTAAVIHGPTNLKGGEFLVKKLISLLLVMMLVLPVIASAARAPEDKTEPVPVFCPESIEITEDEVPL